MDLGKNILEMKKIFESTIKEEHVPFKPASKAELSQRGIPFSSIVVKNEQHVPMLDWGQLTPAEQKELDYDANQTGNYFRYDGNIFDLSNFTAIDDLDSELGHAGWEGIEHITVSSAYVVREILNDTVTVAYVYWKSVSESLNEHIKKAGDKWEVWSHDYSKKLGGPYNTKEEAAKRLGQIEYFKHAKESVNEAGIFKPAGDAEIDARIPPNEKDVRARRKSDTWEKRILEYEPTDIDQYMGMFFESIADEYPDEDENDPEVRNRTFLSFSAECKDRLGVDLADLERQYLSTNEQERNEVGFCDVAAERLAEAGFYVYNSDTRFLIYLPADMAAYDIEADLEESVNEAGLFKPAGEEELAQRKALEPQFPDTYFHGGREHSHRSNHGVVQNFVRGATRGKSLNMTIEGDVLYSYSTPIAFRKDGLIYYGNVRYSVTTSGKHQGPLKRVAGDRLRVLSGREFAELLRANGVYDLGRLSRRMDEAGMFKPADDAVLSTRREEEHKRLEPILRKEIDKIEKVLFPKILDGLKSSGKVEDIDISNSLESGRLGTVGDASIRVTLSCLFRNIEVHVSVNAVKDTWSSRTYHIEVDADNGYKNLRTNTVSGTVYNIIRLSREAETEAGMAGLRLKSKGVKRTTGGSLRNVGDVGRAFMQGDMSGRVTHNNNLQASIVNDVLYSYATPIAIRKDGVVYAVDKEFSKTTTRLQDALRGSTAVSVEDFKALLAEAGVTDLGYLGESGSLFKAAGEAELGNRPDIRPDYVKTAHCHRCDSDDLFWDSKYDTFECGKCGIIGDSTMLPGSPEPPVYEAGLFKGAGEAEISNRAKGKPKPRKFIPYIGKHITVMTKEGAFFDGVVIKSPTHPNNLVLLKDANQYGHDNPMVGPHLFLESTDVVDVVLDEAGLFKAAGEAELGNRPKAPVYPEKFAPYVGKHVTIKDVGSDDVVRTGVVELDAFMDDKYVLAIDGHNGNYKWYLEDEDELLKVLEEGINEDKPLFKPAGGAELDARGYTGVEYDLWIGDYLDGSMADKVTVLSNAQSLAKKYEDVKVYEYPVGTKGKERWGRTGKQIFPEPVAEAGLFKPADAETLAQRSANNPDTRVMEYWYEVFVIENDESGHTYTVGEADTYQKALKIKNQYQAEHPEDRLEIDKWQWDGFSNYIMEDWAPEQEQVREAGMFKPAGEAERANRNPKGSNDPVQLANDLHANGFTDGVDVSPEISLLDYGILRNPKTGKVVFCIQKIEGEYSFDTDTISTKDVEGALEGISLKFYDMVGSSKREYLGWLSRSNGNIASEINDLNMYNGHFTEGNYWMFDVAGIRGRVLGEYPARR